VTGALSRRVVMGGLAAFLPFRVHAACDVGAVEKGRQRILRFDIADVKVPRDPPLLEITAAGRVSVRAAPPGSGTVAAELDRGELTALLREIVEDENFPEIEEADMAAARAPGRADGKVWLGPAALADAPTTFIEIALPACEHAVSVYGLAHASRAHPDAAAIQRLRRIELRLLDLVADVRRR